MSVAAEFGLFDHNRRQRLVGEIAYALRTIPSSELKAWSAGLPKTFIRAGGKRVHNFGAVLVAGSRLIGREALAICRAQETRTLRIHLVARATSTAAWTTSIAHAASSAFATYVETVQARPREEVPVLLAASLGFLVASGGLDGDGGLPDLDLLGGIGAHRSLLTHSIFMGIFAETLILATVDLAARVHGHLPKYHDPFWDILAQRDSRVVKALCGGTSAGLAYHFGVDATIDHGGHYAALKGVASGAVDNVIQAGNAVAEGAANLFRRAKAPAKDHSERTLTRKRPPGR